jgi:hypothetical protein
MAEQTSVDKAYQEGYDSTRNGDFWDDMGSGVIGNTPEADAYRDGAKQGSIDRANYGRQDES